MNRCVVAARAAASLIVFTSAWADEGVLTLDAALARARQQSPAIASARGRVEEARGRLRGASTLRDNPVLESSIGHRSQSGTPADLDIGLSQTLELGGRRGARIAGAQAEVARALAAADDTSRVVLRQVADGFFRALHAEQRLNVARAAETHAADVHRIAERRHAAGDIAVLEVNVAASAQARARSEVLSAQASRAAAMGELRVLLNLAPGEPLSVAGELHDSRVYELDELTARALERPDLRALQAELDAAEAEVRLGRGLAWPDVSPVVRYERDEGRQVLWGGLTVTLPVFNRGQELRAVGEARAQRIRAEISALRHAVQNEISTSLEAYGLRRQAAEELQATLGALDENEDLARRSYEAGQIGLVELLLVRREVLETRFAALDRLLDAAQARSELESRAGLLR
jgi:cobalt-zinc-cadmium efflux system outer membrane protein